MAFLWHSWSPSFSSGEPSVEGARDGSPRGRRLQLCGLHMKSLWDDLRFSLCCMRGSRGHLHVHLHGKEIVNQTPAPPLLCEGTGPRLAGGTDQGRPGMPDHTGSLPSYMVGPEPWAPSSPSTSWSPLTTVSQTLHQSTWWPVCMGRTCFAPWFVWTYVTHLFKLFLNK